jgi:hypothetical protein
MKNLLIAEEHLRGLETKVKVYSVLAFTLLFTTIVLLIVAVGALHLANIL